MSLLNKASSSPRLWCAPEDLLLPTRRSSHLLVITQSFRHASIPVRWEQSKTGQFNLVHNVYGSCCQMHHWNPYNVTTLLLLVRSSSILSLLLASYCYLLTGILKIYSYHNKIHRSYFSHFKVRRYVDPYFYATNLHRFFILQNWNSTIAQLFIPSFPQTLANTSWL